MIMSNIDNLDKIGWKELTVQELAQALLENPPMAPVMVEDADTGMKFYPHELLIDDSGNAPVIVLRISRKPLVRQNIPMTYEERLDEKRRQALELEK